MTQQRIPQTDSIQELARFWDSHDLTDFENELEELTGPVFERETQVNLHLPAKEAQAIEEIAKSKGLGCAELIREWVIEKAHAC